MPSEYIRDLVQHKTWVTAYLLTAIEALVWRASVHDNSKFGSEEFEAYDAAFPELQKYAYGSPELKAVYKQIKPALKHHFEANDHHPEHFEAGINQMDLIQLLEMVCDWLAASKRSQTDIIKGLEINKERFGINDQLFGIIKNTVEYLLTTTQT